MWANHSQDSIHLWDGEAAGPTVPSCSVGARAWQLQGLVRGGPSQRHTCGSPLPSTGQAQVSPYCSSCCFLPPLPLLPPPPFHRVFSFPLRTFPKRSCIPLRHPSHMHTRTHTTSAVYNTHTTYMHKSPHSRTQHTHHVYHVNTPPLPHTHPLHLGRLAPETEYVVGNHSMEKSVNYMGESVIIEWELFREKLI